MKTPRGQALLIAILLGMVLIIAVPVVVFLTQIGGKHRLGSAKRMRASSVAEEGIVYAMQILSANRPIWEQALQNSYPTVPTTPISAASGGQFTLQCAKGDLFGGKPYQVRVLSTALEPRTTPGSNPGAAIRAVEAFISRKTMSAVLSDKLTAPAALTLLSTPTVAAAGGLTVQWGPVVCLSTSPWTLQDPLDAIHLPGGVDRPGYPRKFSGGGITGATFHRIASDQEDSAHSDYKEYWAFASFTFPPLVDTTTYVARSTTTTNVPAPSACAGASCPSGLTQGGGPGAFPATAGFFTLNSDSTMTFDSSFILNNSSAVIVVNGNARFVDLNLDFSSGAFIVNGNLILDGVTTGAGSVLTLNVPPQASLEYAYWPASPPWPCQYAGPTCASNVVGGGSGRIHFRGFLRVTGNVYVVGNGWQVAGSMLVGDYSTQDGRLIVNSGGSLTIYYDDQVNRLIETNPLQLQVDSMRAAPVN